MNDANNFIVFRAVIKFMMLKLVNLFCAAYQYYLMNIMLYWERISTFPYELERRKEVILGQS